jgi:formylglycine-generating enzyme required for sulfatase activity
MAFPSTVSTFRLDEFEVTVVRFRQFIEAGLGTQQEPPAAGAGAHTLNGVPGLVGWDPAWNAMLPADTAALVARTNCTGTTYTDLPSADDAKPQNCIDFLGVRLRREFGARHQLALKSSDERFDKIRLRRNLRRASLHRERG